MRWLNMPDWAGENSGKSYIFCEERWINNINIEIQRGKRKKQQQQKQ